MEILFIYVLVTVVVTGYILLVREKDVTDTDIAHLIKWAEDGHMSPAAAAPPAAPAAAANTDLLPGEEEDHWEDLAEDWEFPEIGKNDHDDWKKLPVIMVGGCRYDRALRGCGHHGKGKQKGGKHINKKRLRRADTKAHLSFLS